MDDVLVGDPAVSAIEADVERPVEPGWVHGHFRIWTSGTSIGNWNDVATLKGIVAWWRDFVTNDRDRWSPVLDNKDAAAVFALLVEPPYGQAGTSEATHLIPSSFARFDVSHLGMSAFDRYTVLLVEPPQEVQRLIWQEGDGEIPEALLPRRAMQEIGAQFLLEIGEIVPELLDARL